MRIGWGWLWVGLGLGIGSSWVTAQETLGRPQPRPERTAEERAAWVAELRRLYARPREEWPAPMVDEGVAWKEFAALPSRPKPTPLEEEWIEWGKRLFFDPRLSRTGEMACASCHDPDLGWADGRTVSFGLGRRPLKRNAPGLVFAAHASALFWDGRADSLETQARMVLLNEEEMGCSETIARELLERPEYRGLNELPIPKPNAEPTKDRVASPACDTPALDRVSRALAAFERAIPVIRAPLDRFIEGEVQALSDEALIGLDLFRREGRCLNCHYGPLLSDGQFHEVGLSYFGRELEDLGRFHVTGDPADSGKFRTPSLRNVALTAPYMHNGLFQLDGVLKMYNAGMPTIPRRGDAAEDPRFPVKSPLLKPLGLNRRDLADLKAFLVEGLTSPPRRVRPPQWDRPLDPPVRPSAISKESESGEVKE